MAIAHNVVTIQGTVTGSENWSTSCAMMNQGAGTPVTTYDELLLWAQAIGALPAAPYQKLADALSNQAKPVTVRVSYVDELGITAQYAEAPVSAVWSTTNTTQMPYQCSVVLSLLTSRPGRSYRGRMYWPLWGYSLAAGVFTILGPDAQGIADAGAQMISDWATAASAGGGNVTPAVNSKVLGVITPITQVSVGKVIDTQRRRRNATNENPVTSPVPPA